MNKACFLRLLRDGLAGRGPRDGARGGGAYSATLTARTRRPKKMARPAQARGNSRAAATEDNVAKVSGHGFVALVRTKSRIQHRIHSEKRDEKPHSPQP